MGKRVVFGHPQDCRQLLAQLARAYRKELLELEAYCLLGTHFHLIVRSGEGTLSKGIQRVSNGFVRWFNRRNRRDGPLFRGRFRSRPVTSNSYLCTLIRYVDHNPVKAGLTDQASRWAWGSAQHYASRDFPRWLTHAHIDRFLQVYGGPAESLARLYEQVVGPRLRLAESELVELRLSQPLVVSDEADELLHAPSPRVARWMRAKAANADGLAPSLAIAAPRALTEAVAATRAASDAPPFGPGRRRIDGWQVLEVGVLNACAGLGCRALAARFGFSLDTASRHTQLHRRDLTSSSQYTDLVAGVVRLALKSTYRDHSA